MRIFAEGPSNPATSPTQYGALENLRLNCTEFLPSFNLAIVNLRYLVDIVRQAEQGCCSGLQTGSILLGGFQDGILGDILEVVHGLLLAVQANDLRCWSLERAGYRMIAAVNGRSREECELKFFADFVARLGSGADANQNTARRPPANTPASSPPSPAPAPDTPAP